MGKNCSNCLLNAQWALFLAWPFADCPTPLQAKIYLITMWVREGARSRDKHLAHCSMENTEAHFIQLQFEFTEFSFILFVWIPLSFYRSIQFFSSVVCGLKICANALLLWPSINLTSRAKDERTESNCSCFAKNAMSFVRKLKSPEPDARAAALTHFKTTTKKADEMRKREHWRSPSNLLFLPFLNAFDANIGRSVHGVVPPCQTP